MPETMKLLGSTKSKISKDKIGENLLSLEIIEIVLIQCNIVNYNFQQDSRVLEVIWSITRYFTKNFKTFLNQKTFNS